VLALTFATFAAAATVTLVASFVKGAVGFALPMIMISGLATFMPAEQALATLIIPTLLANLWQGLRGGWAQVASVLRGREGERGTTPQDLNQIVQLTSAGMTRTLDRLEAAGHVVRERNPDDRRSVLVRLTAHGRRSAEEVTRALADGYASVLNDASAKDVVRHNANLREVLELLSAEIA